REGNRVSQQVVVAHYLKAERSDWRLTDKLVRFGMSADWRFAMNYRNRWVHEQPPLVDGLGIQYRRELPWIVSKDKSRKLLAVGAGDPPEFNVAELLPRIQNAYRGLIGVVASTMEEYFAILHTHGVERKDDSIVIELRF